MKNALAWVDDVRGRVLVVWKDDGKTRGALSDGSENWGFDAEAVVMPDDFSENFAAVSGKEAERVIQAASAALSSSQAESPWKGLSFLASEEEQRDFAKCSPGDLVITPLSRKPGKK